MEAEKPVQQAFGSPGGKSYLAPRIAGMIPPHKVYVEPFAGGAAVYFRKEPSDKEVLSDKDKEIAFAFRFIRDMTPQQLVRLKQMDWRITQAIFNKLKTLTPEDDVERFYKFYYIKKASFGSGTSTVSPLGVNNRSVVGTDRLWRVHERLKNTKVHNNNALALIDKYDGSDTFFYLDPPYPKRAFIGQTFDDWTEEDLKKLTSRLQHIKGKFALSLGTEHTKFMPKGWNVNRVKVLRRIPTGDAKFNQSYQYEIVATNYPITSVNHRLVPLQSSMARRQHNNKKQRGTRKRVVSGLAVLRQNRG